MKAVVAVVNPPAVSSQSRSSVTTATKKTSKSSSAKAAPLIPAAASPMQFDFSKVRPESPLAGLGNPDNEARRVSFLDGAQSALDYAKVGGLTGTAIGCVAGVGIGAVASAGVGSGPLCLLLGGTGGALGTWVGAVWGFIDGAAYDRDRFGTGQPDGPDGMAPFRQ